MEQNEQHKKPIANQGKILYDNVTNPPHWMGWKENGRKWPRFWKY